MAYTTSGALAPGESYQLGEYTFSLANVVVEDERVLQAHCTNGEESAAKGISVPTSARLENWSVEADETEASVYANVVISGEGNLPHPIATTYGVGTVHYDPNINPAHLVTSTWVADAYLFGSLDGGFFHSYAVSSEPFAITSTQTDNKGESDVVILTPTEKTVNDETIYVFDGSVFNNPGFIGSDIPIADGTPNDYDFYSIIYGDDEGENGERLVARFAIDLTEAGGGPGGGWIEPGDDGDPFKTLHLTVVGAHSGRHNDPMGDTSYSYLPADKLTVAGYGCGGDGGHGGGGGAGASTVIIHKFATSQADSKDLTALARGHGYGSGGGKGGKGGDGILLIYYREATP